MRSIKDRRRFDLIQILNENKLWFDNSLINALVCVMCKKVLKDAMQVPCGCRYCRDCLMTASRKESGHCLGTSEECLEQKLDIEDAMEDTAANREIGNIEVKCINSNLCPTRTTVKEITTHCFEECQWRMVACTSCQQPYLVTEEDRHQEECPHRLVTCPLCQLVMTHVNLQLHMDPARANIRDLNNGNSVSVCSLLQGQCQLCGQKDVYLVKHNLRECSQAPVGCIFEEMLGCDFKGGTKDEAIWHLLCDERGGRGHITTIMERVQKLNADNESFRQTVSLLQKQVQQLQHQQPITTSVLVKSLANTANSMQEDSVKRSQSPILQATIVPSRNLTSYISNRSGICVWKIEQFTELKKNAYDGVNLSRTSEAFYSSEFGYKLCMKIYPNGDGPGKGTHLSVYFALMRGDYDEVQAWPFKNKVTLGVLDPFSGRGVPAKADLFKPDPNSSCYQQPSQDNNVASGSPRFMSHQELERYLKKDILYLRMEVHQI